MNEITIEQIAEALALKKTDRSVDISLIIGCTFWETEFTGVFLTDYDIGWQVSQPREEANLLKTKQCVKIIVNNKIIILSAQAALDAAFVRAEIRFHINN